MLSLYYPPFRADDDVELLDLAVTGIRAYVEDLAEFMPETLAAGWRTCRREHKTERWPTIGAIREACLDARPAAIVTAVRRQDRKSFDRWPFAVQADEALGSPQGQWCLRHGCGLAYWERMAEGRVKFDDRGNRVQVDPPEPRELPSRDEVAQIHAGVQRNAERAAAGFTGPGTEGFANMWRTRVKREAQLAEQFLRVAA